MKKNIFKKVSAVLMTTAVLMMTTACNTKIDVDFGTNASENVKLGQYKGITVAVDAQGIEDTLIEKKVMNDAAANTTYEEVSREAREADQVNIDFTASIGGEQVSGFSDEDYDFILGTDTFVVEGFADALYGMTAGQVKIVTLTVPEDFEDAAEYAGRKIVFEITMNSVQQPNVPMITDAYVQENFSYDTVAEYRQAIKDDIQETIDERVYEAKKAAVLTQLQENCEILNYPEEYLENKKSELDTSIKFYALMQSLSNDEYCQNTFGMSFDEYVKRTVAQDMILHAIVAAENLTITEYEYKGDLESFADEMGFTNKDTFVEKYGKDTIVKAMLIDKAQDIVMENAIYE